MAISVADQLLGLLGGTFDPLHIGHLRTALDVRQALGLSEVLLIPNNIPGYVPNDKLQTFFGSSFICFYLVLMVIRLYLFL